jgi:hypothetical protein
VYRDELIVIERLQHKRRLAKSQSVPSILSAFLMLASVIVRYYYELSAT